MFTQHFPTIVLRHLCFVSFAVLLLIGPASAARGDSADRRHAAGEIAATEASAGADAPRALEGELLFALPSLQSIVGNRARMLQIGAAGVLVGLYIIWWRR